MASRLTRSNPQSRPCRPRMQPREFLVFTEIGGQAHNSFTSEQFSFLCSYVL